MSSGVILPSNSKFLAHKVRLFSSSANDRISCLDRFFPWACRSRIRCFTSAISFSFWAISRLYPDPITKRLVLAKIRLNNITVNTVQRPRSFQRAVLASLLSVWLRFIMMNFFLQWLICSSCLHQAEFYKEIDIEWTLH